VTGIQLRQSDGSVVIATDGETKDAQMNCATAGGNVARFSPGGIQWF